MKLRIFNAVLIMVMVTTLCTIAAPPATSQDDLSPPTPDPMLWKIEPYPTGSGTITMTAVTATDENPVEYNFQCTGLLLIAMNNQNAAG